MTGLDHDRWEELVAGFALDALEPGEEADLRAHLAECPVCVTALAEHRETAAALAGDAPAVAVPDAGRDALLVALGGTPLPRPAATRAAVLPSAPAPVVVADVPAPRARERRRALPVAVALVAVVVAGLSVVVARQQDDARREQTDRARQVALCLRDSACQRVDLVAGGRSRGIALVREGRVQLVVDDLPANDETSRVYVLWQLSGGTPRAVGSFDVRPGGTVTGQMSLPRPAAGSTLAITLEPGRTPPRAPSTDPLAAGTVA